MAVACSLASLACATVVQPAEPAALAALEDPAKPAVPPEAVEVARRDFGACTEPITLVKSERIQSKPDTEDPTARWDLWRIEFDTSCSPSGWLLAFDRGDRSVIYPLAYCEWEEACRYFVLEEPSDHSRAEGISFTRIAMTVDSQARAALPERAALVLARLKRCLMLRYTIQCRGFSGSRQTGVDKAPFKACSEFTVCCPDEPRCGYRSVLGDLPSLPSLESR